VGLERGPFSLVSTIEELLGRKNSGSGLEIRDYGRRGSVMLNTWHPLSENLALILPTSGGRSVDLVRSKTKPTGFFFFCYNEIKVTACCHTTERNEFCVTNRYTDL
jgi:hypothetical protein